MLRIHLLGRPHLALGDAAVSFTGRPKVLPLLGFLLLHPAAPIHRERVASALWPDETDTAARANLRRHLHYLQALLPRSRGEPWICTGAQTIHWNARSDHQLDVDEFQRCAARPELLAQAVELYAGELMEGVDEPWLAEPRRHLGIRYATCLLDLIALHRARRSYRQAQHYARMLLAFDPWHEDALRALLIIHYEAGDRAGALSEYRRFERALAREMGAEPMPETIAVYRSIQSGIAPPGAASPQRAPPGVAITEPLLVGRDAELATLTSCWQSAASAQANAVSMSGEAGIGKSRLARECALKVESQGGLVVFGATPGPDYAPYQSIAAILRSLSSITPQLNIDPVWLAALHPLAPELRAHVRDLIDLPVLDAAPQRARLFEAIALFLEATAAYRPLCIVLEDLHWSGPAALELAGYLVRRLRESRILWILTWREGEALASAALRDLRRVLVEASPSVHLPLRPLLQGDCEELLRELGPFGDADATKAAAARLHRFSGGNPFYLLELARTPGVLADDAAALPDALRAALVARTALLGEEARTLLQVAAVVGTRFDLDVVSGVTGWSEAQCLDALEELVDNHLVHERAGGSSFSFSHHLVAAALYDDLDDLQRRRRHRRIAHILEIVRNDRAEFQAAIATHYDKAGDNEHACEAYLRAASFALSLYANEEARNAAQRALQLSPSDRNRFEGLDILLRVSSIQGDRRTQARLGDELLEVAQLLGPHEKCRAMRKKIDLANAVSDHDSEREWIARLQMEAERNGDPVWIASALEARTKLFRSTGAFAEEERCFLELASLGSQKTDRNLYAEAYISHADTLIYQGRLNEAREILAQVRDSLDAGTNRSALIRTLMAFSRAALALQDYATMAGYAEEAFELSRSIGDVEGEALAQHNIANGMVYSFRVTQARAAYSRTLELYDRLGHQIGLAGANVDYGVLHAELGLLDEAMTLYGRALAIARAIDFRFVLCVASVNIAHCERLREDYAAAKTAATQALDYAAQLHSTHLRSAALGTLGAAERELGELDAAIEHLQEGIDLRRTGDPSPRLGDNLCALAATQLRAGNAAAARAAADELMQVYDTAPHLAPQPTEWLRTAAQVYAGSGDAARARSLERAAIAAMERRAAAIPDASTREAFLRLPFNRAPRTRY